MAFPDTSGATDSQNMPVVRHHIERGDSAKDADGTTIGMVVQLVMDRATGQPSALVIQRTDSNAEFELPWSHIVETSGGQVRLDVSGKDFASVARPYNADQYVPVDTGMAMPLTQAGKIAQHEGHPVVTAIQPDSVELMEPQAATDETTKPYATLPPSELKRTAPLVPEPMPPTQPLVGRRQSARAQEDDTKTETERDTMKPAPNAPPVETSPLTSTEGELVGGKPSTSGVGESSTVPTPGSERSTETPGTPEQPLENLAVPTSSAGRPEVSMSTHPVSAMSSASAFMSTAQPSAVTPGLQFGGKVQQLGVSVQQTARQVAAKAQQTTRQVAQAAQQTSQQAGQTVAERWNTPLAMGLAAAGMGTGALVGAIVGIRQRRASRSYTLKQAGKQIGDGAALAQDVASIAQEKAARASLLAKRTAKRTARRVRWFRNGLLIGGVLGILFAPEAGAEVRSQLANRVEQWRSKIA